MTGRQLELSYNWRGQMVIASIVLVVCGAVLVRSQLNGWIGALGVVVVLWAAYLALVWSRSRALMIVDGHQLTVRRVRRTYLVDGRKVESVREYLTNSGSSYKIRLTGDARTYYVPTALLRRGHSTFFNWLLRYSPSAELDKRARRSLDELTERGLIEDRAARLEGGAR
jgi:hypothetical protein